MPDKEITLRGRAFVRGDILAQTGLHIGGGAGPLSIGGVDNPVVRDPITNRPYIPGSSLRGKMRSLAERSNGLPQNQSIGKDVRIHVCGTAEEYRGCDVCHIFGVPARSWCSQTRLIVRDVPLRDDSARALEEARTDLPFTEVKWEAAIDRVTSAATPRQVERVPAGAVFGPMEISFALYEPADTRRFSMVLRAMQLLEEDFLGGGGSRGNGKVRFQQLSIRCRPGDRWDRMTDWTLPDGRAVFTLDAWRELPEAASTLEEWLRSSLRFE